MKNYIFSALFILFTWNVFSQSELQLGLMRNVYQSSYVNPGNLTDHKVSVGLPMLSSMYFGVTNSGFAVKHALSKDLNNDIHELTPDKMVKTMTRKNFLYAGASVDLLHVEVKIKNFHWSISSRERLDFRFGYPRDLVKLPFEGNGAFAGDMIDFSGLALDFSHYNETGIGFTMTGIKLIFGDLVWGGRVKFLTGRSNIHTDVSTLSVTVSDDIFEHYASGRLNIVSSGLPIVMDGSEMNVDQEYISGYSKIRNWGLGVDVGANLYFNDFFSVWGSITDLGYIRWKSNLQGLDVNSSLFLGGYDIGGQIIGGDTNTITQEKIIDSLRNSITVDSTLGTKYTTYTSTKLNIGMKYTLRKNLQASVAMNVYGYRGLRTMFHVGLIYEPRRWFNFSIVNTMQYRRLFNLGFAMVIKPGPVQVYMISDNLIGAIISPYATKSVNFRIGINFVFGKEQNQAAVVKCPDFYNYEKQKKARLKSYKKRK